MTETTTGLLKLGDEYGAHNYHPLPVVAAEAEGAWVTDVEGRRYLDMLAAYSALNFGHGHPRLIAAARQQLERLTLVSRAFQHDQFGPFCAELADLADMDVVLPMNTGAEAVETAIKVARKWGYTVKGVPDGQAVIIAFDGNFHGRTTTIVSFSTDPDARDDFGPYTPGFRIVPYGDLDALTAAVGELGERVVAVLVEPIQGEAGVVVPPPGFLAGIRELCTAQGILMIADEIQSGLGRTGYTFACAAEGVVPDAYLLGKALGGGIVPVSAMVSTWPVLGVLHPGQHGSTFGGNPLACAVGREVVAMLRTGEYQARARVLGERLHARLAALPSSVVSLRARPRPVGRAGVRVATRTRGMRAARRPRRAGQGDPRQRDQARAAADHQRGRPGLGAGPDRGRDPGLARSVLAALAEPKSNKHAIAGVRCATGASSRTSAGGGSGPRGAPAGRGRAGRVGRAVHRDHPADDDAVVAAVVDGEGLAFQRGQRAVEQRRAGDRARVVRLPRRAGRPAGGPGWPASARSSPRPRPGWTPPRRRPPARRRGTGRSSPRRTARAAARARPTRTR